MKAWRSKCEGFPDGYLAASTRGRALMASCSSFCEVGYGVNVREAMKHIRVTRAPEHDRLAEKASFDGQWLQVLP